MAFRDFTFPNVLVELDLTMTEEDLFRSVTSLELSRAFLDRMRASADLAVTLHTEKARSEFIVAPILLELKFGTGHRVGVFSGVQLDIDTSRGLNGVCDFVLTRSPLQAMLTAPVLAIVEAKNDNIPGGLGQCIASTVAAREFSAMEKRALTPIYGAVTTGTLWRFLRLDGSVMSLDLHEYHISDPGRILAILSKIIE